VTQDLLERAGYLHHILCDIEHPKGFHMATVKVDNSNFQADVLQANEPVVVDFWAEWCGPCKMIAPALEEIATELGGKVKIAKLNIDENPELAAKFGVRSIPTLMIFKAGEVADIKVGAAPKTALSHWINGAVA
jgi:thioredoxin 1